MHAYSSLDICLWRENGPWVSDDVKENLSTFPIQRLLSGETYLWHELCSPTISSATPMDNETLAYAQIQVYMDVKR
jgi:hypothetical protein